MMRPWLLKFIVFIVLVLAIMFQQTCFWEKSSSSNDSVRLVQSLSIPTLPTHIVIPLIGVNQEISEYTNEMVLERDNSVRPIKANDIAWWFGVVVPEVL